MKNKIISLLVILAMTFSVFPIQGVAEDSVEVYITVTDITDYTEPFNVLVERHKMTVSEFNLADYGDTMAGIECIEGVTYLHALVQLHRNLYGDKLVADNIMLNPDGYTKIFMGRSVANIMYKNGKDIFAFPQLINIKDGDEIQVCLYDEGHSQAVATFNEAIIRNVSPNEVLGIQLQQHYSFPRLRDPISGAEITTGDGEYLLDKRGNIVTTDENGNFNVSFSKEGTYTLSIMPTINYYMDDSGGGIKVEWKPQTTIKEVEYEVITEFSADQYINTETVSIDDTDTMVMFVWGDEVITADKTDEGTFSYTETETRLEEVTELVRVETIIPDLLSPMVTYTTPFITVDVTTDLVFEDISLKGNTLRIDTKNYEYHRYDDMYVAGYIIRDDGVKELGEIKTYKSLTDIINVGFSNVYDYYKIFVWENGTMTPIIGAEAYNPNTENAAQTLDYDFTMSIPENTYTTVKTMK